MIQPIVGIKLNDKRFLSLLNSKVEEEKSVILYRDDFDESSVPLYICKMQKDGQIEKIYKVGELTVSEHYLENVASNDEKHDEKKDVVKITSSVKKDHLLIYLYIGREKNFKPLKMYELNIYEEISNQDIQERDMVLLDYGDFVKSNSSGAELIPEEDLTSKGLLKETESEKKVRVKKVKFSSKEFYKLAEQSEESRSSVAGKMLVYSSIVMILALAAVICIFNWNYRNTVINQQKEFVKSVNERVSYSVTDKINQVQNIASIILNTESKEKTTDILKSNSDILAVIAADKNIFNLPYLKATGLSEAKIIEAVKSDKDRNVRALYGKNNVKNSSQILGQRSAILFMKDSKGKSCGVVFKIDSFEDICLTESKYSSFVVDREGYIIAGLEPSLVMRNTKLYDNPVVNQYLVNPNLAEVEKVTEKEISYGIFSFSKEGEVAIITSINIPFTKDFALLLARESLYAVCALVVIAMIFIWLYGMKISTAIKALTAATYKIGQGNFDIKLKNHRRDEIGVLSKAFEKMGKNLALRDNAKQVLGRFADNSLEEKALKGELKLDGENRFSTVMYCGIRNFKNISKRFRPEEILLFLNNYYYEIEKCVTENGGFVDKLSGDRLLAVFGSPVSSGTPKQDALNCINTAEKLRTVISEFNEKLEREGKPAITIGLGIDSGNIIAGQLGSKNTQSYTCLGKTISIASEVEKLTKKYDCRVIITENTEKMVKDFVFLEQIDSLTYGDESIKIYSETGLK